MVIGVVLKIAANRGTKLYDGTVEPREPIGGAVILASGGARWRMRECFISGEESVKAVTGRAGFCELTSKLKGTAITCGVSCRCARHWMSKPDNIFASRLCKRAMDDHFYLKLHGCRHSDIHSLHAGRLKTHAWCCTALLLLPDPSLHLHVQNSRRDRMAGNNGNTQHFCVCHITALARLGRSEMEICFRGMPSLIAVGITTHDFHYAPGRALR